MTCRHSSPPITNNLNAHNPLSGGTESKKAMKAFLPFSSSWCWLSHESSSSLPTHCIPHIAASIVHSHIHPPTWPFHLQRQQPCFLSLFFSVLMSVFDWYSSPLINGPINVKPNRIGVIWSWLWLRLFIQANLTDSRHIFHNTMRKQEVIEPLFVSCLYKARIRAAFIDVYARQGHVYLLRRPKTLVGCFFVLKYHKVLVKLLRRNPKAKKATSKMFLEAKEEKKIYASWLL